ncbi:MAG: TRAP transporter fused permease subunit [Clostridia bacterium]|nr:TRAP transporter fused permease subunit [Clostridia bacterium]
MASRVDEVMKKYDRESNVRVWNGAPKWVVTAVLASFSILCLYIALLSTWSEHFRLPLFMAYIIVIGFLVFPAKKGIHRPNYIPWYDVVLMAVGSGCFLYMTVFYQKLIDQSSNIAVYELIIGILAILVLAELCRRAVGLPILIVAGVLILYALFFGLMNPSLLGRLTKLIHTIVFSVGDGGGIMSIPIGACAKFIVVFIIFGAFLERTGISDFFIKAANLIVGRFSGGPAKVAVVASALEGMVSGSSVANTVGSGAVTIPLMKKTGYSPEFAAAAEASASTGGQIMPPILGAAAFLMAEYVGVGYGRIVLASILPALLYFVGVFVTVHLEAKKNNLRGLSKSELPDWRPLVKKIYLLIPLCLLIALVSFNLFTIQYSAALAIAAVIIVGLFNKENRITPKKILESLAAGAQGSIAIAAACGIAGIISGVISATGLANIVLGGIINLAGNQVIVALFLTMFCCIILGMGVPTTANYCIMATICAPILMEMGVPAIAAHFFVFYFGIVADLTPPVALASYAGAAIAQSNPMKTALQSTKLAIAAFIVPYVFALNPVMLFEGLEGSVGMQILKVVLIISTSLVGIFGVSSALEGYLLKNMNVFQRILAAAGGILLIDPNWITDIVGLAAIAAVIIWQVIEKKAGAKPSAA